MKITILAIVLLLAVTEIRGRHLRSRVRGSGSNLLDRLKEELPIKELIELKIKLLPFLNKFLPKLQTILGGSQIPRRRPTKESEFNAAISHARSTLFNTTNSQAIF